MLTALLGLLVRGTQAVPMVLGAAGVDYLALTAGLMVAVHRANAAARRFTPPLC